MNWVEHVRAYANRKGISYKEALKCTECKETYHKQKGEQKEVEKGNKEFNKRPLTKIKTIYIYIYIYFFFLASK